MGWGVDYEYKMAKKPVNYGNVFDSKRCANRINKGQPRGLQGIGATEDGSYTTTESCIDNIDIARNMGTGILWPNEDEWFKASFHEARASIDDYWFYPARSDNALTAARVLPSGDFIPGKSVANHGLRGMANVDTDGPLRGSYCTISGLAEYVWEWAETRIL